MKKRPRLIPGGLRHSPKRSQPVPSPQRTQPSPSLPPSEYESLGSGCYRRRPLPNLQAQEEGLYPDLPDEAA